MSSLEEIGFEPIGAWRTKTCVVHKDPSLKHEPGLYAFVVDGVVRYVGKAKRLHRRLRRYSNRFPEQRTERPWRRCHAGLSAAIEAGQVVHVYVRRMDAAILGTEETRLIRELKPGWNGSIGAS